MSHGVGGCEGSRGHCCVWCRGLHVLPCCASGLRLSGRGIASEEASVA